MQHATCTCTCDPPCTRRERNRASPHLPEPGALRLHRACTAFGSWFTLRRPGPQSKGQAAQVRPTERTRRRSGPSSATARGPCCIGCCCSTAAAQRPGSSAASALADRWRQAASQGGWWAWATGRRAACSTMRKAASCCTQGSTHCSTRLARFRCLRRIPSDSLANCRLAPRPPHQ